MRNTTHARWWPPICVIVLLAGCEPVPKVQDPPAKCSNREACETAAFVATFNQSSIGMKVGPGVTISGIQAIGSTVVMDLRTRETAAALGVGVDPRLDSLTNRYMADATALAFCTPDPDGITAKPFLDQGGKIRLRVISSDGLVVTDSTVTSCNGVR